MHNVTLTMTASAAITARTDSLSLRLLSDSTEALLTVELQVVDRTLAKLSPNTNQIIAGPAAPTNVTIEVTNIGTLQDTFLLSIGAGETSNFFELSLSKTSVVLGVGQSESVVLSVRETSIGANSIGSPINIVATSTLDPSSTDTVILTLIPMNAGSEISVVDDDASAEAGGIINGSFSVSNTGNSVDVFSLSSVNIDCIMESLVELQPGESKTFPYTCNVPDDGNAGSSTFSFRSVSSARPDSVHNKVVFYTIEATWNSDTAVNITVEQSELMLPYLGGSSTTVSITNLANIQITGRLTVSGVADGVIQWHFNDTLGEQTDEFTLEPGASEIYVVRFDSMTAYETYAEVRIKALVEIDGSSFNAKSDVLELQIKGEPQPPQGVSLLGVEIGKQTTLQLMAMGYILFALAVVYIRLRKPRAEATESEEGEQKEDDESKEYPLGPNECRMDTNRRISCPSCEARLAVPGGNEPPFRFTCPTCDSSIRVVEYGSAPKF
tara:strand:- start:600 stop:2087 length:1488 start_codon:yes stop_codon:yes gene_type:complete